MGSDQDEEECGQKSIISSVFVFVVVIAGIW